MLAYAMRYKRMLALGRRMLSPAREKLLSLLLENLKPNNMPQFQTIEQAFEWFLENIYPDLPTENKMAIRDAKYIFYKEGRNISNKKMQRILEEYTDYENVHQLEKSK